MLSQSKTDFFDEIYFGPAKQGSYSTLKNLMRAAKRIDPEITYTEGKEYLKSIDSYTKHRRILRKFPRRKFLTYWPYEFLQCDVIYLKALKNISKGGPQAPYALVCVDTFSRQCYAHTMRKKTPQESLRCFKLILKDFGDIRPKLLQTDNGNEFLGVFKVWCTAEGINLYHTKTLAKATIVESCNYFLKLILARIKTHSNSSDGGKFLAQAVKIYNDSISTGLPHNFTPNEAIKNISEVQLFHLKRRAKYATKIKRIRPSPEYKLGQSVRLLQEAYPFTRGFAKRFGDKVFTIVGISTTTPRAYAVSNDKNARWFYKEEITPVYSRNRLVEPRIQSIISSRTVKNGPSLRSGGDHLPGEKEYLCAIDGVPNKYLTESQVLAYVNGDKKLKNFLAK